jgi:energy-converting hydrogenase A subunit M
VKITGIIWLEDIVEKLAWKHNVQQHEVVAVLQRRPKFRLVEKGHREGEQKENL